MQFIVSHRLGHLLFLHWVPFLMWDLIHVEVLVAMKNVTMMKSLGLKLV